jgi:hypothetical protein
MTAAHAGAEGNDDDAAAFGTAVQVALRTCLELGYRPSYFMQMLAEHGPIETTRLLISTAAPSAGFVRLWEFGRLDLTVEALALRPEFASVFSESERAMAARRLSDYGYHRA